MPARKNMYARENQIVKIEWMVNDDNDDEDEDDVKQQQQKRIQRRPSQSHILIPLTIRIIK